jgi:Xaa-Pro aminopeptidase
MTTTSTDAALGVRADRVLEQVAERDLDALLVSNLVNVRWLCGFTGSSAAAVIGPDVRRFLTDFRYLSQSAEEVPEDWDRNIGMNLLEQAAGAVSDKRPYRLGFDDHDLSVADHARLAELIPDGVELVPAGGVLERLRAVKDAVELDKIRAASRLADAALEEVLERGIVGRTEKEVAFDLETTMRRMGASGASFDSIVAAGEHGALPHAHPRDVAIPAGTLVTIDWGCMLEGYASDSTRTFATGEPDPRDAEIYAIVLEAQEKALAAVRPGPLGREVDAIARDIITAAGHGEHFGHGLGHGVGLEVHEGPRLSQRGEEALVPGNVVSVEPGIYVPGAVGVRIEDLVAVTEDGHEVLNTMSKELRVVS